MNKAIFECCKNYDLETLKRLLEEDPDLINERNEHGETPLIYACHNWYHCPDIYNPEIIQTLIDAGSDIYAKDNSGDDAFTTSLYCGADYYDWFHPKTPEMLLKAGYRVNKESESYKAAYEHVLEFSQMCDVCSGCPGCVAGWIGNNLK